MKKFILLALLSLSSISFSQQIEEEKNCVVQSISNYTQFGGGDVLVFVRKSDGKTVGYWLEDSDPGFQRAYDAILLSLQKGSRISIGYYHDPTFTGNIPVDQGYDSSDILWDGSEEDTYLRIAVVNMHK